MKMVSCSTACAVQVHHRSFHLVFVPETAPIVYCGRMYCHKLLGDQAFTSSVLR